MARIKWGNIIKTGTKVLLDEMKDNKDDKADDKKDDRRPPPRGRDIEILVAPRDSEALAAAKARGNDRTVFAERRLFRALGLAAEHLNSQGPCTVTLRIAGGEYPGKARTGTWLVPKIDAPHSTLRILGGYDASWGERKPFENRSFLVVASDRTAPVLQFEREGRLTELYLSGLVFDAGASNEYDTEGQLLTGQSNSYEVLAFSYMEAERIVIADNTFVNAGHRVAETLTRAKSERAEIILRNNLVMNSIMAWRAFSAKYVHQPARYLIEHNSFVLNWPHAPDRTTSNPAALEIGDMHSADHIEIRRNLFAYNVGGAIYPGFEDVKGPKMTIRENLFWGNGALFEVEKPGSAAVVGKFNRARQHIPLDPIEVEDDFEWDTADNVVQDPGLKVQVVEFEGFSSVEKPQPKEEAKEAADQEPETSTDAPEDTKGEDDWKEDDWKEDDWQDGDSGDDSGDTGDAFSDDAFGDDVVVAGDDGWTDDDDWKDSGSGDGYEDLSWGGDDGWGGQETYLSKGFAPRLFVDAPDLPFPRDEASKAYGASPDRVEQL